jgi:hypothetical protein
MLRAQYLCAAEASLISVYSNISRAKCASDVLLANSASHVADPLAPEKRH